jgi:hypothetical protein
MGPAIRLLASRVRDVICLVLVGIGVSGCSACPKRVLSPLPETSSVLTRVCYHPDEAPPPSPEVPAITPPIPSRPLQILALSGGVAGAPFTAGVLVGWTRTGTRPLFDQVTGISSGSLIGAYSFLGPKYDAKMQHLILSMKTSDLIKFRPLYCMLCDGSFGSSKPAARLIQRAFDDEFIADLRCAHAEGRRLYIGTMNLETKRLAVWDLGAIASSGRPDANDLVRKILLASVSWPGAVPPVAIDLEVNGRCYREEHCDAGSVAMTLPPIGPLPHSPAGADLYVLASRKLYSDSEPVPKCAFRRLKPSVTAIFEALTRANISELFCLCMLSGMHFHLLAVPQDYHGEPPSITHLYPKEAHQLFEIGYQTGAAGPCWRRTPPGAEGGEGAFPRDGREIR